MTSRTPRSESAARAISRRRDSSRAAYSPRNSGWYSRANGIALTFGLDLAGDAAQVAARDVAGHVDPPRGPLALDLVRGGDDRDVGHVAERDVRPERRLDRQACRAAETSSRTFSTPQTNTSKIFWSLVHLADLRALDQRGRRPADVARGQAEPRGGLGAEPDVELRHEHLRLDLQVGHARHDPSSPSAISCALSRRTARSGPKIRTTTVAPAPVSTSLMRSFR